MTKETIKGLWNSFRDNSINTLIAGPGTYELCVGDPLNPTTIKRRIRKDCRSEAKRESWEFRKIRDGEPTSNWYSPSVELLQTIKEHKGEVFFRQVA